MVFEAPALRGRALRGRAHVLSTRPGGNASPGRMGRGEDHARRGSIVWPAPTSRGAEMIAGRASGIAGCRIRTPCRSDGSRSDHCSSENPDSDRARASPAPAAAAPSAPCGRRSGGNDRRGRQGQRRDGGEAELSDVHDSVPPERMRIQFAVKMSRFYDFRRPSAFVRPKGSVEWLPRITETRLVS